MLDFSLLFLPKKRLSQCHSRLTPIFLTYGQQNARSITSSGKMSALAHVFQYLPFLVIKAPIPDLRKTTTNLYETSF